MLQDKMWLKMPDADNAAKSIATIEEATKLLDEAHRSLATVEDGLGPKLERLLRATQRSEASCNKFQGLVTECTGALITRAKALTANVQQGFDSILMDIEGLCRAKDVEKIKAAAHDIALDGLPFLIVKAQKIHRFIIKLKTIKTVDVDEGQLDTVIKKGRACLGFSLAAKTLYEEIPQMEKPRDKSAAKLACRARLQQQKVFELQPLLIREGLSE